MTADRYAEVWDLLVEDLKNGRCIPFLGAGVSAEHLPLGGRLAAKWAEKLGCDLPGARNLSTVMQFGATMRFGDGTRLKQAFVDEEFSRATTPSAADRYPLHALLAKYPLPLYVTTNYDDFMYLALRQQDKEPERDLCQWFSRDPEDWTASPFRSARYAPTAKRPLVFHLHGHHSLPQSLVLTDDDYIDFGARLADGTQNTTLNRGSGVQVLPREVRRMLRTMPILFLGYSLSDWNLLVLFRTLTRDLSHSQMREHISVQMLRPQLTETEREYTNRYFEAQKIRVLWETPESLIQRLV
ncbi:SIR2 family NAD-dependent protein deacylase [Nonomuraea sp. NPDC050790]|uniref:SIR2 family NAD-dependent protein deacylase n=1 Tax=Nonomuraea sp. NPDC050790 TaxID=3364371 RepID=UPI00378FDF41